MEEQLDPADVAATILGFHINELPQTVIPAKTVAQLNPDIRSAYLIRQQLEPYIGSSGVLKERLQMLAAEPSESARQMLADELRRLFESESKLRGEIEEIIYRSPYAVLFGLSSTQAQLDTSSILTERFNRNKYLSFLFGWIVFIWVLFAVLASTGYDWILPVPHALQGVFVVYYANLLRIKRPFWLGIGAMLPGNIIYILLAMAGYRRENDEADEEQIYYTGFTKTITAGIAVVLILLPVLFYVINTPYMQQVLENVWGIAVIAAWVIAYALVLLALQIGFWRENAKTGIGIALASTIAGWGSFIVVWITLLGPSFVQVIQMHPEAFGW